MKIVTGYKGTPHVTANDDQGLYQGIMTTDSAALPVGNMFNAELASNNELKIYDGEGIVQGVHFRVLPGTYDSVTLENGSQGKKRKDLIVVRYTKDATTGVEDTAWVVKKGTETTGTPTAPTATEGDIRAGDTLAEVPWYVVEYDGLTVSSVTKQFGVLMNAQQLTDSVNTLNSNLAGLISVEQRGVTLMADWCHIADKSGYYLLAAFNIRGDTNHPVTGIQRPGTGGYTIIISGGTNGTQHALWLVWGKAT